MLKIIFSRRSAEKPDILDLGDCDILGSHSSLTSRNHVPDWGFMVYISIIDLLDSVYQFVTNNKILSREFVASDSSFSFTFYKANKKEESIVIESNKIIIDIVSIDDFVNSVIKGVENFLNTGNQLQPEDTSYTDLVDSFSRLKKIVNV